MVSTDGANHVVGATATSESATAVASTPKLMSVDNFRDLAGPARGYRTGSGRSARLGVVYRSNALSPNASDLATLSTLGIRAVYDLRTTKEVEAKPDKVPLGAKYVRVDILGDASSAASVDLTTITSDSARAMLSDANRDFVANESQRREFATLLTDIAEADGPVVVHCTSGKDRTGWASALLLTVAGVSQQDIMSNYLLTNQYSAASIDATARATADRYGTVRGEGMRIAMGVFPEALQAGFDQATRQFGGMDGYLKDGLGLGQTTLDLLKSKLTV
ncbi:tyrosine-protein phosphatase [Nocardia sp. NPDC059246]|uniref:tyrosine-protein phosphatase n=1 Tax=unclassified Nocardia TaxID=2637762 RepID=UPI0036AA9038